MMSNVVIIGSGVVGAAIAYELSKKPNLNITLLDEKEPASGSTGAALGILIGYLSHKIKGRAWEIRSESLRIYETLLPELEELSGIKIPCNRQGIVKLLFEGDNGEKWQNLINIRTKQGFTLQKWDLSQLRAKCPQVQAHRVKGAIYSPGDRQLNPRFLTKALVAGAVQRGVKCMFGQKVQKIQTSDQDGANKRHCTYISTRDASIPVDWLILASGTGTNNLISPLSPLEEIKIRPVLGQALLLKRDQEMGNPHFQPVITGNDVHIAPLGGGNYGIGATVEFPNDMGEVVPNEDLLKQVTQEAISFCPSLSNATIVYSWSGKRPRPEGKPAPVIERLAGFTNIILATGHYRNGVLLAPATAIRVAEMIHNPRG
jgi:glycine/D-amino acid oxidase-like deaminating enzyme